MNLEKTRGSRSLEGSSQKSKKPKQVLWSGPDESLLPDFGGVTDENHAREEVQ